MNKPIFLTAFLLTFILLFSACGKTESTSTTTEHQETVTSSEEEIRDEKMIINIKINNSVFTATLEDNEAAKEFYEMVKSGSVIIEMSDYSGFEKVGPLGKNLTSDDKQTKTKKGDIVLYNGNQIVMFYGSNSWSYTRLGKIDDLNGWETALGSGDITAEFTVKQ